MVGCLKKKRTHSGMMVVREKERSSLASGKNPLKCEQKKYFFHPNNDDWKFSTMILFNGFYIIRNNIFVMFFVSRILKDSMSLSRSLAIDFLPSSLAFASTLSRAFGYRSWRNNHWINFSDITSQQRSGICRA